MDVERRADRLLRPRPSASARHVVALLLAGALTAAAACSPSGAEPNEPKPTPVESTPSPSTPPPLPEPDITPSPPVEQPRNTDFEGGTYDRGCPAVWTCDKGGAGISGVDDEVVVEGAQAMRIDVPGEADTFTMRSESVPASELRSYTASIGLRTRENTRSGVISLRLLFYNADGERIGAGRSYSRDVHAGDWDELAASGTSPRRTKRVGIEVVARASAGTLWVDEAELRGHPVLEVWGGTGVRRSGETDVLTIQATTPTPGGVYVGSIDIFGTTYQVADEGQLAGPEGERIDYTMKGSTTFDAETRTIRIKPGDPVVLEIVGSFTPTPGTAFPRVVLNDPVALSTFPVYVAAQEYQAEAENGAAGSVDIPDRIMTWQAIQGVSGYFDTLRTDGGGWKVAHDKWPGDLREDPQAIGILVQGYLRLATTLDDPTFRDRAKAGLGWLMKNQRDDGGFGLPWAFGSSTGHFPAGPHYDGGDEHPPGEPLGVVTIAAGNALLQGYRAFGDERYLDAANDAMDFLLRDPVRGFRWLDKEKTRGSIPYCTLEPAFPPDDPRSEQHEGVLPELQNTSLEVYNIDGGALSFLTALYNETGDDRLLTFGDALATNLYGKVREDGSIPYSWYEDDPHSAGYATITARGLLEYAELRDQEKWRSAAIRGYIWIANNGRGAVLPEDGFAAVYGIDMSADITAFVRNAIIRQGEDGSFSYRERTRYDAVMFAILAQMLADMGG